MSLSSVATRKDRKSKSSSPRRQDFDALCDKLVAIAKGLGPGEKLPRVSDLCSITGVSVMTVDRALSELEARKLIVRRNGVGIFVADSISKRVIALVCDPTFFRSAGTSWFWSEMIEQSNGRAKSHDEVLDFHFTSLVGDNLRFPDVLLAEIASGRIGGMIYMGAFEEGVAFVEGNGVPVVTVFGPSSNEIRVNYNELLYFGARELAMQGCKRIALWDANLHFTVTRNTNLPPKSRTEAFEEGIVAGGGRFLPELIRHYDFRYTSGPKAPALNMQERGYTDALDTFSMPRSDWPDGIVIADDMMTLGVMAALQVLGIEVGRDVKIATHVNRGSTILMGWEDRMTCIQVDPSEIVSSLFARLESLMSGEKYDTVVTMVSPKLLVHSSACDCAAA